MKRVKRRAIPKLAPPKLGGPTPGRYIVLCLLMLAACTATPVETPTPAATATVGEPEPGLATVENIEVVMLESMPVQVNVIARGHLPDGCTEIDTITQGYDEEDRRLWVKITTLRQPDPACTQALVPFEETVPLDVYGLPAGTYTVDVNGVTGMFALTVDNVLPPVEGLAPVSSVSLRISESFPVQVAAVVRGSLPDGCTKIDAVTQTRDPAEKRLQVTITTLRPQDQACTEAEVPYEETVPLDVLGLPAGTYTVVVNDAADGGTASFTLEADNLLPDAEEGEEEGDEEEDATPTPTPTPEPTEAPEDVEVLGPARLASMDIQVNPTYPVTADVIARGTYPDSCTEIGQVNQRRDVDARLLWMELILVRPEGVACTQELEPFEETFALDLSGLPAGEYTVDVNGITGTVILGADNP
jgi:hypothetical protein